MRNVKGWGATIVVLCAACVEPEGLEPVEPRGGEVEARSCPAFSATVDAASLPEVQAALSGCTEVAGTLELDVVEHGLQLELPMLERVLALELRWASDAHISMPALHSAAFLSLEGTGSVPHLPMLEHVPGAVVVNVADFQVLTLPTLVTAGTLDIFAGSGLEVSLPNLRAVAALRLDCMGGGPGALGLPALLASPGGVDVRNCGAMKALDLPRLGEGAIYATNAPSLVVVRGPLLVFGHVVVGGAPAFQTVQVPSLLEGSVRINDATNVSMALPAMIRGDVQVAAFRSVSLDLPHLEGGSVSALAMMEGVVVNAPNFRDGAVDVSSAGCARTIRLPELENGHVIVRTGECADDVLTLPRALWLDELRVSSSVATLAPSSLALHVPRLSYVGALWLSVAGGPEVDFPALTSAGFVEVLDTAATRVSLPVLNDAAAILVKRNGALEAFELPELDVAGELVFEENGALPQCAIESVHAALTEPCPLTTSGNDELAVCE